MKSSVEAVLKDFTGLHKACRNSVYPRSEPPIKRATVGDDEVDWKISVPHYHPISYTSSSIIGQVWADKDIKEGNFAFNSIDGKLNRRSFMGKYALDVHGRPVNPMGRTGISERGILGRWGPNHAADPIVTRWKRDENGAKMLDPQTGQGILEFVAIERRDSGQWAIPGGMVDAGEEVSATLKREFGEETLSSLDLPDKEKQELETQMEDFFQHGRLIYHGYVDDPRNTDNAWMETVAVNFHDEEGDAAGKFQLNAGDDAANVRWTTIGRNIQLYASHKQFIHAVSQYLQAHW